MEAAVSVSLGSLSAVLEKLQIIHEQCSSIIGVRAQVAFLRSELTAMHAFLLKMAAMEQEGPIDIQVKVWAQEVRELSYDVEDCVDSFTRSLHLAGGGQGQGGGMVIGFFRKFGQFLRTLHSWYQFKDEISTLKNRVVEIGERRERYKLDDLDSSYSSNLTVDLRLSALFADENNLVGINGPRDELVRWLVDGQDGLATRVLSIVGFGGLGKTTLARKVYHDIQDGFSCKVFITVSQKPNLSKILWTCLCQLLPNHICGDIKTYDEAMIITEIRQYLADKRYLVVLDDVWSTFAWDGIRYAFPENNCSSRIITTTRIIDVAHKCCSSMDGWIYEMKPLAFHHSKSLFLKRMFSSDACPEQLQEVSDEILKKCGGLPLAIISISGLLANKPTMKEEWEKVRNSIGSALEKHENLEGLNSILIMSYNDLPHNLKTCFLYLSVFPEDYIIERDRLVNRWLAEGFIAHERGLTLEDVAESYFYELINRSMVQPIGIGYDGKARGCRVHDIMLELIISKAAEENFVSIIGGQGSLLHQQGNIRRLSIQQVKQETPVLQGQDLAHVRSLTAFGPSKSIPHLDKFDNLRVLDFEGCSGMDDYNFDKIDRLCHLKYLSLRDALISKIPSKIIKLNDLKILDLRGTEARELPFGIVHLTKLQQLLVGSSSHGVAKLPDGIGNMKNLQILSGFDITASSTAAVDDLRKLTKLNELGIQFDAERCDQNNRYAEVLMSSLRTLGSFRLKSFWICNSDSSTLEFLDSWSPLPFSLQIFRMTSNFYFLEMPKWISPALRNLKYLNINLSEITEQDLCILGELSTLLSLHIWFLFDPKERVIFRCGGFQCLKELHYVRRPYIVRGVGYIVFEIGSLPKLENVQLPFSVSMAKENGFYIGIEHLRCLKRAEIIISTKDATSYETEAAAKAIHSEASSNPNHPILQITADYYSVHDWEQQGTSANIRSPFGAVQGLH